MWIGKRFKVLERIGEGGIFQIYKCIDIEVEEVVVIRRLREELHSKPVYEKLFNNDYSTLNSLNHPNIPFQRVIELYPEKTKVMVLEYLNNCRNLNEFLSDSPAISEISYVILQLGDVIDYINNKGILHNDIQPRNILITEELKLYLVDFGTSSSLNEPKDNDARFRNIDYASPQTLLGFNDFTSDIYSFGIILFKILTGSVPFKGATHEAKMMQKAYDEIPLNLLNNDEFKVIILKALAKEPKDRFKSARILAKKIVEAINKIKSNVDVKKLDLLQEIKNIISENRIVEAIEKLIPVSKGTTLENDVILVSSSFRELKKEAILNIQNDETIRINKNKIRYALIKITDSLRNEYLMKACR